MRLLSYLNVEMLYQSLYLSVCKTKFLISKPDMKCMALEVWYRVWY
jgi:hypothetical protein